MGQLPDEAIRTRQLRRPDYILVGSVWEGDFDVFLDGAAKEHAVLQHHPDLTAEPGRLNLCRVHAIDEYPAVGWQVQPLDQLGEGTLAGAGTADNAHPHASLDIDAEAIQHIAPILRVPEGYMVYANVTTDIWQGGTSRIEGRFCLFIHDISQPLHGYPCLLEILPHIYKAHNRCNQLACQHLESNQLSYSDGIVHDVAGTYPENGQVKGLLQEQADSPGNIGKIDDGEHCPYITGQHILIPAQEVSLDAGTLDSADTGNGFNQEGIILGAYQEPLVDHPLVNGRHHQIQQDKEGQEQHHYQSQYRAVENHDQEAHQGKEHIQHDGQCRACHEVPEIFHLSNAGHHVTHLPAGEVLQGQCGDIPEQAAGKCHIHLGGDVGEQVAPQ